MKTNIKRSILILSIALLLAGAICFGPQVCFAVDLYMGWYERAESVYTARLSETDAQREKVAHRIQAHMDRKVDRYYKGKLNYDEVMAVFKDITDSELFSKDANRCIRLVDEMETARANLAQADVFYANGDYARAIPLFRRSLIADDSAASRLAESEEEYRKLILLEAKADMDEGRYDAAEGTLLSALEVLGRDDEDLIAALKDARYLQKEQNDSALLAEARRLMQEEGPEAAIVYMADLRRQSPGSYELEYMEQMILHECEEQICAEALSLKEASDLNGACSLLKEGLQWIDSSRMKFLLAEIRGSIVYLLGEMPMLQDESHSLRTGAASTIGRDQVLMDSSSNEYSHSFYADIGSVSLALEGDFSVFTGTVAFPKGETSDIYRSSATLQVIGDGTMIAEFKDIGGASDPVPFYLPVDGVKILTLRWISDGANGWKDWGRFATIFDGLLLPDITTAGETP